MRCTVVVLAIGLAAASAGCVGPPPPAPAAGSGSVSTSTGAPLGTSSGTASSGSTTTVGSADGTSTGTGQEETGPLRCSDPCPPGTECIDGLCTETDSTSSSSGDGGSDSSGIDVMACESCVMSSCFGDLLFCFKGPGAGSCQCCFQSVVEQTCDCPDAELLCEPGVGTLESLLSCTADSCGEVCGLAGCAFEPFVCSRPSSACQ